MSCLVVFFRDCYSCEGSVCFINSSTRSGYQRCENLQSLYPAQTFQHLEIPLHFIRCTSIVRIGLCTFKGCVVWVIDVFIPFISSRTLMIGPGNKVHQLIGVYGGPLFPRQSFLHLYQGNIN